MDLDEKVKRVMIFVIIAFVILTGLFFIGFGFIESKITRTPLIPIDQAGVGNHVKVTPVRVVDVFDKVEEKEYDKHSLTYRTVTIYYSVVEVKEIEGACIIMTSRGYPTVNSREIEGLVYLQPEEEILKAQEAMKSHDDLTLYSISVDEFFGVSFQMIFGAVMLVVGTIFLVLHIRHIKKRNSYY